MADSRLALPQIPRWSPLALVIVVAASIHLWLAVGALRYGDFAMVHATTRALLEHRPAYTPHALVDGLWWNMNPPQFHLLTIPLAALPVDEAAQAFRFVNLLALVLAVGLLFDRHELGSRKGGWLVAAALSSPALVMALGAGQVAGCLALLLTVSWRAAAASRWLAAGAAIGALCAFKPIFWPLTAWLLLTRRWVAATAALVMAGALILLSIMLWGGGAQWDWLHAIGAVTWFDSRFNASWAGLGQRLAGPTHGLSYRATALISATLALAVAVRASRYPPLAAFAQCVVGSTFAAPLGWIYYLCVAGPLVMRRAYDGSRWPMLAWLLWLPMPLLPDVDAPFPVRVTLSSAYAWGMLGLATATFLTPGERTAAAEERPSPSKERLA